ncbi:hypothetical protein KFK09_017258 [Dendrobium nobile]|uniref:Uncharacterized protein n=1 Tax=Dendrobium nobile TaxID=94219 RepID=A0A8T3B1R5_DENNO|nr:hypothetical protein KFK09_017258 [Dendrobium nobile]
MPRPMLSISSSLFDGPTDQSRKSIMVESRGMHEMDVRDLVVLPCKLLLCEEYALFLLIDEAK